MREGDGKNPAHGRNTTWISFERLTFAFLTPSSFGPRLGRGNSKTLPRPHRSTYCVQTNGHSVLTVVIQVSRIDGRVTQFIDNNGINWVADGLDRYRQKPLRFV